MQKEIKEDAEQNRHSSMKRETAKGNPDYDAGYKQICSIPEELLHFLKKYVQADWVEKLEAEDIHPYPNELILPDYERRIPDLVFEVCMNGENFCCYLIVQMQSSVDFTMAFRFAAEIQGIQMKSFLKCEKKERERKAFRIPAVVPILLYNGRKRWTAVKDFSRYQKHGERYGEHVMDFSYYLVDISQISDTRILNSNYLIDNIIYLDKHRYDLKKIPEKLSVILKRIRNMEPEKKKMFWDWMEHVLAVSVEGKYRPKIKKIIEESKGEENMFKYAITDMIEKTMNEKAVEGWTKGLAEGRTEGRIAEAIRVIIRKLDQGLSTESIAYWLEKEMDFVEEVKQLHNKYPKADEEKLAEHYREARKNRITL